MTPLSLGLLRGGRERRAQLPKHGGEPATWKRRGPALRRTAPERASDAAWLRPGAPTIAAWATAERKKPGMAVMNQSAYCFGGPVTRFQIH